MRMGRCLKRTMTPEQFNARKRRLVSAAKALLSLQVGLYVGARRIEHSLGSLGPDFQTRHNIFSEFTDAVPIDIPVGSARLLWDSEVVMKTDSALALVESRYRTQLMAECVAMIRLYGSSL